jgi:hypothetical protein
MRVEDSADEEPADERLASADLCASFGCVLVLDIKRAPFTAYEVKSTNDK